MLPRKLHLATVLFFFWTSFGLAQLVTDLTGVVVDSSGAAIPNAHVELTSLETEIFLTATANGTGEFRFKVPPGHYRITATAAGFGKKTLSDVSVSISRAAFVKIALGNSGPWLGGRPSSEDSMIGTSGAGSKQSSDSASSQTGTTSTSAKPSTTGASNPAEDMSNSTQAETSAAAPSNVPQDSTPSPNVTPTHLTWNTWPERSSGSPIFSPAVNLRRETQYDIVVDLSAIAYSTEPGVHSRTGGEKLQDWLMKNTDRNASLQVLMLPDSTYFIAADAVSRVQPLRVDLQKMRRVLSAPLSVPGSPFEVLKSNSSPDFEFGRVVFNITTGSREGSGYVAFSIWADGIMPVDEFSVALCIADDDTSAKKCKSTPQADYTFSGLESVYVSAQEKQRTVTPDAALHFVQLAADSVIGVFRTNNWKRGEYITWRINRSATEMASSLMKDIVRNFEVNQDPVSLLNTGLELYRLLFPLPEARQSRKAFYKFINSHIRETGRPASIFVRMLPHSTEPLFLVPLGLMTVELAGTKEHLGFHFRIETPLQVQNYESPNSCLSKWVMLLPPEGTLGIPAELINARSRFASRINGWSGSIQLYEDINKFADWIGDETAEDAPTALLTLSHHDADSMFFADSPRLGSSLVGRQFANPSLAIIDACGAAGPVASDFIRRLNEHGVVTIVASSTNVNPYMAGDFLEVLSQVLAEQSHKKTLTISLAEFETLNRLRHLRPPQVGSDEYGAKVLGYSVLGNGNLRLCLPGGLGTH